MGSLFTEIEVPSQRNYDSFALPNILTLNPSASTESSLPIPLSLFIDHIKAEKPYLENLLFKSGAILFRGFPVNNPSDFNDVIEAFGYEEFAYKGAAPRTKIVGRVYTANEAPPDQEIPFHHEMTQFLEFPSKLLFYCDVEPISEGETPIALSHIIHERMKAKYPDYVKRLEEHGIVYNILLGEDEDPSLAAGRSWKSTFSTDDKTVAEKRAAELGIKLKWLKDGAIASGPTPAIRYDRSRDRKIWFNSIQVFFSSLSSENSGDHQEDDEANDHVSSVTFGDGKPLPGNVVKETVKMLQEESVAFPWKRGDVLLIDNWAVLHSRKPAPPPRRIFVSLCK